MVQSSFRTFGKLIQPGNGGAHNPFQSETYNEFESFLRDAMTRGGGLHRSDLTKLTGLELRLKLMKDGSDGRWIRVTIVNQMITRIDVYENNQLELNPYGIWQPKDNAEAINRYEYVPGRRDRIAQKFGKAKDKITRHRRPNLDFYR